MGIPDTSGHFWKNSMNYTAACKDDKNVAIPGSCFRFLVVSFLD